MCHLHWLPFVQNIWFGFRWKNKESCFGDKYSNSEEFEEKTQDFTSAVNEDSESTSKINECEKNTFLGVRFF